MLTINQYKKFIIYPSWACLYYQWEELPFLLKNPLSWSKLNQADLQFLNYFDQENKYGFNLIDGNLGGGIIVHDIEMNPENPNCYKPDSKRWLGQLVLNKETVYNCVRGISVTKLYPVHVCFLTPRKLPQRLARLMDIKQPREYECWGGVNHIKSAGDNVYGCITIKGNISNKIRKKLEILPNLAKGFNIIVTILPSVPATISEEIAPWFQQTEYEFIWFSLNTPYQTIDHNFACLFYCALSLRKSVGKSLLSIQLLGQLESQLQSSLPWCRQQ
jgi:hypothetical protein